MPLIPLTNGSWVSAEMEPVFAASDLQLDSIPIADALYIIDPGVSANLNRRNLFKNLGAKTMEKADLCAYICEAHCAPTFNPRMWTTAQLVTQVTFLYQSAYRPPEDVDLWFATLHDGRCKGSEIYLRTDYTEECSASRIFHHLKQKFPILHPDYGIFRPEDTSWISFLTESLNVSAIPRLVSASKSDQKSFRLSDEFRYLFGICDHSDVLGIINEYWHKYSIWLEADKAQKKASTNLLLNDIADLVVQTPAGPTQIRDSVFPGLDPWLQDEHIPSLEIDSAMDDLQKERLSRFGIATFADARYYLSCLKSMCNQFRPEIGRLSYLYEQIQDRYDGNEDYLM
jgi:hypothetical protein